MQAIHHFTMIKETLMDTETVTLFVPAGQKDLCFNIFKGDPCSKCEEGWEQHGGKCYYFSTNKSSWNESRDDCRAKGGDLVKIDSMMTAHEDKFWIGLTDSAEQGRWLWVDGSPLNKSLSYWNDNEPDNWPEDDCVMMESNNYHRVRCTSVEKHTFWIPSPAGASG
uniref:C-type lectin domain-containing protein n=1 Tax=Oreochromis aureus TaxID=47969 RepID=A0A668S685_OREAU